jgi:hypothetical protein
MALEQLVDQLPARQATALRLTILEGLSHRAAAAQLEISPMAVQPAQKRTIAALRHQQVCGSWARVPRSLTRASAQWLRPTPDRSDQRLEHSGNLQLLIGPLGCQSSQQAVAVAVNTEHDVG